MADFFSELPGWAKGTIAVVLIGGGGNVAQYFGLAAPAQQVAAAEKTERHWCIDKLDAMQEKLDATQAKLERCWEERSR
jgi:hypothetical protein